MLRLRLLMLQISTYLIFLFEIRGYMGRLKPNRSNCCLFQVLE
jgi:hypothetical protein